VIQRYRYDRDDGMVANAFGNVVLYSDAEVEIEKARREGEQMERKRQCPFTEDSIRADERGRIVRGLIDLRMQSEAKAERVINRAIDHIKGRGEGEHPAQEPKPLVKPYIPPLGVTSEEKVDAIAVSVNALVDAVNFLVSQLSEALPGYIWRSK